jgi:type I restriction enzyme S subunit
VTGVGQLPTHWSLTRLKFVTRCLDGQRIPLNAAERGEMLGDVPYWGANSIVDYVSGYLFDEDLVLLGEDGAPFFEPGRDVAFSVSGKIWPNNHVHVLRPDLSKVNIRFLTHVLNCVPYYLYITGSTRDKLNQSDMNEIWIRWCPLEEQTQIAKFLDYETAKIDALIAKQQQLIALLQEKRQAVISHAATKGVIPNVSLKDSGISWVGKIPAHWRVLPVKRLFDVSYGLGGEIDRTVESGTNVISLPNVKQDGTLDLSETSFRVLTKEERKAAVLKKGDLLFNWRNGSIEHVGKTALFNEDGDYAHVSFLLKLRALSEDVLPEFFWLALNGLRSSGFFGSSKLQVNVTYNQTELRRVPLPVPPVEEQRLIVDSVLKKYEAIDMACERIGTALALLQERRTALIAAAVTGKIDVRGWQPPPAAAAGGFDEPHGAKATVL